MDKSRHSFTRSAAGYRIPALVLVASLSLTLLGWSVAHEATKQQVDHQFHDLIRDISREIDDRLLSIEESLHASRGLIHASKELTSDQWLAFQHAQRFDANHSGTLGVGLAAVVPLPAVEHYVASVRAADHTNYMIWPPGARTVYAPLRYTASRNKDTKAFGFDMYSEPRRRAAMERARDTGAPTLSEIVRLLQAGGKTDRRGTILFLPVYSTELEDDASVEQRRAALTGYVECPLLLPDFFADLTDSVRNRKMTVRIADARGEVLFSSTGNEVQESALRTFDRHKEVYGQTWLMQFEALPGFGGATNEITSTLVAVGGLVISLLLFATVIAITATRLRAETLARRMTAQLRTSEERFRALTALSADWYWEQDAELRFTSLSGGVDTKTGHSAESSVGKTRRQLSGNVISEEEWSAHQAQLDAREPFYDFRYRRIAPNGETRWVCVSGEPFFDERGEFSGYRGIGKDVTAAVLAEQRIFRLNALYGALTATNASIAHTKDSNTLFHEVCRILVEHGGIAMAWVGRLDAEQGRVHMLASFGAAEHYTDGYGFSLDPMLPEGRGYVRSAVVTRQVQVAHDLRNDERIAAWRERSQKSKFLAKAVVPLVEDDRVAFCLQLYSQHLGFFDAEMVALLARMGNDLSFALENLQRSAEREKAIAALAQSEERLQLAMCGTKEGIFDWNIATGQCYYADNYKDLLGYDDAALGDTPRAFEDHLHPDDRERTLRAMHEHLEHDVPYREVEYRLRTRSGEYRWFQADASAKRDASGKAIRFSGAIRDITARKVAEQQVARLRDLYSALSQINHAIIHLRDRQALFDAVCDIVVTHGHFVLGWIGTVDPTTWRIHPEAASGSARDSLHQLQLSADPSLPEGRGLLGAAVRERAPVVCNDLLSDQRAAARHDWFREVGIRSVAALPLRQNNAVIGLLVVESGEVDFFSEQLVSLLTETADDISFALDNFQREADRRAAEERLLYLANYDELTGLPNRTLLYDRLRQSLAHSKRTERPVAVMFLDLDRFKVTNDTMGHTAGDELLRQVAERLQRGLREGDSAGRLGGDEFAVVLADLACAEDAGPVLQRLLQALQKPYEVLGQEIYVTVSAGISLFPSDGHDADILIGNADAAMYRAKENGRSNYQFYEAEMNARSVERLSLERHLQRALEREEFLLHYQPKVSLATGEITGVEALLRWQHPELGLIPPNKFIPILEDNGLIVPVGEWVLHQSACDLKDWLAKGLPSITVAVNLSGRQLQVKNVAETMKRILSRTGTDPRWIELEVTESILMHSAEHAVSMLNDLKQMGVRLSIDDFGTGYSSLSYLSAFPLDSLKIDRSFVRDIHTNSAHGLITQAVTSLAHSLHLKVIAEGVETQAQLSYLTGIGCDEMQGYFFSRPVQSLEIQSMLAERRRLDMAQHRVADGVRTLLLVDDEPNILAALKRLLRRDEYRILTANNPLEALELLAINSVDVVMSDQRMPEMTGVEFLRRVRDLYPDTVRLVLSGYTDLQSVTDAINQGAVYKFLTKPWDDEHLRASIKESFAHKRPLNENRDLHTQSRNLQSTGPVAA